MTVVRQSTARTITVGPVLDASGVAVTDSVISDFKCSKNGGAPAALDGSATLTHRHTGHYSLTLTGADLDTVGSAEITCDDTVNACQMRVLTVIEEAVYDALYAASAAGYGTAQTGDSFERIGAAGVGLTGVPWNAAWDAEVQSECADALTAFGPPTNAQLEARTIVAANYATAANLATVAGYIDTEIAAILTNVGTVDTVVDAIKATTDQFVFTVANQVDSNALSGDTSISDESLALLVTQVLDGLAGRVPVVQVAYDPVTYHITLTKGDDFKAGVRTIDIPITLPDGVAFGDCTATFGAAKGSERIDREAEVIEVASVIYLRLLFDRDDTQEKPAGRYNWDAEVQYDDAGTINSLTMVSGVLTLKESYALLPTP